MVKLRLFRVGATKRPVYRIVAVDGRRRRESRVLESVGTYDPVHGGGITLDDAAVAKWLERGARASETVSSILRRRKQERGEIAGGQGEATPTASA